MKVSIITVSLNSAATIRSTIESVLGQSYPKIEYIVVDGKSSDQTCSIIEEYRNRIATFICESDSGIYDAMNKGVQAATGDVVGILNSDDFFSSPQVVEEIVETFRQDSSTCIVFGDLIYVSPEDLTVIRRFYSSRGFRPWKLRFGIMPPHPATFVRRDVYQAHGNYRLSYRISADYEMFVRWLMVYEIPYRRIDKVLVHMRTGGVSTAGIKSNIMLNREIIRACKDNGVYTNWLYLLPKVPIKILELFRRPQHAAMQFSSKQEGVE